MILEGKVAIVAGAGRGIGAGVAHVLAEEGADISALDISQENADKVAEYAKKLGRRAIGIRADLTKRTECEKAVKTTLDTFGKLDILVNIVGGRGRAFLTSKAENWIDVSEEEWDEDWALNVKSHVFMCQAVAPHFMKQQYGKIVNMASTAGQGAAKKDATPYSVVKAADIRFTRDLAMTLAEYNINVNNVQPGSVYTLAFTEAGLKHRIDLHPEKYKGKTPRQLFDERMVSTMPMKKAQTAEDIGNAIAFMVSDQAHNITGQCLNVDGGWGLL